MPHRLLTFLLASLPIMAQSIHIDHVTVAGRDVRAMQRALEAAGVPTEYGGEHSNHATEMALTSFPDGSYLEVMGIQQHADPAAVRAHVWHAFLDGDAGPCAWAVRRDDMSGYTAVKSGRKRPDGVELRWETAQVGSGQGNFFPFLIHDFTPRDLRAYPSGKPTTTKFAGVSKVYLAVKDLDAAIAEYQKVYKLGAPKRSDDAAFGARLAMFEGTPVVLAAPLGDSWLAERLQRFGEAPCAFVLRRPKSTGKITWLNAGWRLGVE